MAAVTGGCAAGALDVEVMSEAQLRRAQFAVKMRQAEQEKLRAFQAQQQAAAAAAASAPSTVREKPEPYYTVAPKPPYVPFEKRAKKSCVKHTAAVTNETFTVHTQHVFPFKRLFRMAKRVPAGFKEKHYRPDLRYGRKQDIPFYQEMSILGYKHGKIGRSGRVQAVGMRALAETGAYVGVGSPHTSIARSPAARGEKETATSTTLRPPPSDGTPASDLTSHCTGDVDDTASGTFLHDGTSIGGCASAADHVFRASYSTQAKANLDRSRPTNVRPVDVNPDLDAFRSHLHGGDNLPYPASPERRLVRTPPPGEVSRGRYTVALDYKPYTTAGGTGTSVSKTTPVEVSGYLDVSTTASFEVDADGDHVYIPVDTSDSPTLAPAPAPVARHELPQQQQQQQRQQHHSTHRAKCAPSGGGTSVRRGGSRGSRPPQAHAVCAWGRSASAHRRGPPSSRGGAGSRERARGTSVGKVSRHSSATPPTAAHRAPTPRDEAGAYARAATATPSKASLAEGSVGYDDEVSVVHARAARGRTGSMPPRPKSACAAGRPPATPKQPARPSSAMAARRATSESPGPVFDASFPSSTMSRLMALRALHERSRSRGGVTPSVASSAAGDGRHQN